MLGQNNSASAISRERSTVLQDSEPVKIAPLIQQESSTPWQPPPPPDGGVQAWVQVTAAFCLTWNSLGLLNSFGSYQTYYEETLLRGESSSAISWIGSVQVFLLMTGGFFFGPLVDLGYTRSLIACGTFLVVLGFMMTSLGTEYYQIMLSQGFCIGIGSGCLYMPAITLVPGYFSSKRALAMGIAAVGSSVGASIYPLIFESLVPKIGFGWTLRTIGFIVLLLCSYSTVVARPRLKYKSKKTDDGSVQSRMSTLRHLSRDAKLFETRYLLQCVAITFSNLAFFQPMYYIQSYAQTHGTPVSLAKYLLVILNLVAIPGRIIPAIIADRIGVILTFTGICCSTAIVDFYWIAVTTKEGNIAFSVLYGFFSSSVVTLSPVVLSSITDDMSTIGTRLGCVAVLKGLASLIGPPIAGAILDTSHSYLGVQLFTAVSMTLTTLFTLVLLRVTLRHKPA